MSCPRRRWFHRVSVHVIYRDLQRLPPNKAQRWHLTSDLPTAFFTDAIQLRAKLLEPMISDRHGNRLGDRDIHERPVSDLCLLAEDSSR